MSVIIFNRIVPVSVSQSTSSSTSTVLNALTIGTDATGTIKTTDELYFPNTSIPISSEGYDVFLLIGQSNMSARGSGIDTLLDTTDPRILQLGQLSGYNNQIILARDALQHADNSGNPDYVGLTMSFSRRYLASLPAAASTRKVLLVPSAYGASGFSGNRWNIGNDLYAAAVARANTAMAAGLSPSYNRFCGILMHQGEADTGAGGSGTAMTQNAYAAALDAMIAGMRSSITGATNVPFICGLFVPAWVAANSSVATPIQNALIDTPNRVAKAFCVSTTGLVGDVVNTVIHFSAASQRTLGDCYYYGFMNINIPTKVLSLTAVAEGANIRLTWIQKPVTTAYKLYQKLSSVTTYTLVSTVNDVNTAAITSLIASTSYDFKVVASNSKGDSVDSNIASATTAAAIIPSQVTGMTAGTVTSSSIAFSWSTAANATTYKIFQNGSQIASQAGLTYNATPLTASTSYSFTVRGNSSAGDGPLSTALVVSTISSLPTPVWQIQFASGAPVVTGTASGTMTAALNGPNISLVSDPASTKGIVMYRNASGGDDNVRLTGTGSAPNTSYSKTFWLRVTTVSASHNTMSCASGATSGVHYCYAPASDGQLAFGHTSPSVPYQAQDPTPIVVNTWTFYACTYLASTTTMTVYRNGVQTAQKTTVPVFGATPEDSRLGTFGVVAGLVGYLYKPAMYNSAITAGDVLAIYNAELV